MINPRNTRKRNPYGDNAQRRSALAWMAERGITEVRPIYVRYWQPEFVETPRLHDTAPKLIVCT